MLRRRVTQPLFYDSVADAPPVVSYPLDTDNMEFRIDRKASDMYLESGRTNTAYNTNFVGAIDDLSGHNRHATQGTAANEPRAMTKAFQFDGTNDLLESDTVATNLFANGNEAFTLYLTQKGGTDTFGCFAFRGNVTGAYLRVRFNNGALNCHWRLDDSTITGTPTGVIDGIEDKHTLVCVFDGGDEGDIKIYKDKTLIDTETRPSGTMSINEFYIGNATGSFNHNGDIMSCIVYSGAHSDTDREAMTDWLNDTQFSDYVHEPPPLGYGESGS